jgi:hypothetical protein
MLYYGCGHEVPGFGFLLRANCELIFSYITALTPQAPDPRYNLKFVILVLHIAVLRVEPTKTSVRLRLLVFEIPLVCLHFLRRDVLYKNISVGSLGPINVVLDRLSHRWSLQAAGRG